MANLIGQLFGNYRLVQLLGQGGFADVYLAEHVHLNSRMAVKVLQSRLVGSALEQFRNEGRSIASLVHPNIVRVFDFGIEDCIPFLVMDYAPNGTLRQRYPKGIVLSPTSVLPYVKQVAQALYYAHSRKLIHRDIKPENILLGEQGEALLSDFGLVLPAQSTSSQTTKEMAGTLPYMAPEQINGKPRPASDQYALGIVIYEWLSGKRPFEGTFVEVATQHMMTPPAPLYGKVPGVSSAVQEVLFTALAKDPQQRFASIQAFATAFESACQAGEVSVSALPPAVETPSQRRLDQAVSVPTDINTQSPTEMATPDPSSAPTYIKTPDFLYQQQLNTPSSPEQPLVLATQPGQLVGEGSATWAERQPTSLLTPDMPPGLRSQTLQRKKGRARLLVVACMLIFALVGSGLVYVVVNNKWGGSGTGTPGIITSATVTITPISTDLKNTYTITAVAGTPDATQHQVAERMISMTTSAHSQTVSATGQQTTPGTHATGSLTFANNTGAVQTGYSAGTTFTGASGVTVVLDASLPIAYYPGTTYTEPAHAQVVGTVGNIVARDVNLQGTGCHAGVCDTIVNNAPFTGGKNSSTSVYVTQNDIDGAAQSLIVANQPDATQTLQGQIHANERLVGTPSCKSNVQANHNAGDHAANVTVTVSDTCTGEVYDQDGALAAATQWLKDDAKKSPGTGYVLVGQVKTTLNQTQITDANQGTVSLSINAEGIWVYQFNDAQRVQLAQALVRKSKSAAQTVLQNWQGVKQAAIQLTGNGTLLPNDSHQISIVVQQVTGL